MDTEQRLQQAITDLQAKIAEAKAKHKASAPLEKALQDARTALMRYHQRVIVSKHDGKHIVHRANENPLLSSVIVCDKSYTAEHLAAAINLIEDAGKPIGKIS